MPARRTSGRVTKPIDKFDHGVNHSLMITYKEKKRANKKKTFPKKSQDVKTPVTDPTSRVGVVTFTNPGNINVTNSNEYKGPKVKKTKANFGSSTKRAATSPEKSTPAGSQFRNIKDTESVLKRKLDALISTEKGVRKVTDDKSKGNEPQTKKTKTSIACPTSSTSVTSQFTSPTSSITIASISSGSNYSPPSCSTSSSAASLKKSSPTTSKASKTQGRQKRPVAIKRGQNASAASKKTENAINTLPLVVETTDDEDDMVVLSGPIKSPQLNLSNTSKPGVGTVPEFEPLPITVPEPAPPVFVKRKPRKSKVTLGDSEIGEAKIRAKHTFSGEDSDAFSLRDIETPYYRDSTKGSLGHFKESPHHHYWGFNQIWKLKEKRQLQVALESHHPDDIESIQKYIKSKSPEDIKAFINYLKDARGLGLPSEEIPEFVAPMDMWVNMCDDLTKEHENHPRVLAQLMSLMADVVGEQQNEDDVGTDWTTPCSTPRPNYQRIYQYLSDNLERKPPSSLSPYESAIVVDLLQTLANTINAADISHQREVMTEKHSQLSLSNLKETTPNAEIHSIMRTAMGFKTETNADNESESSSTKPGPSKIYSSESFMWMDRVKPVAKSGKKGRPCNKLMDQIYEDVKRYQTELQVYSLNPFGVTKDMLKIKRASKSSNEVEVEVENLDLS